jgi:hypothetical protein
MRLLQMLSAEARMHVGAEQEEVARLQRHRTQADQIQE